MDDIQKIKEVITSRKPDLTIYRVPKNTLEKFKAFASNDEFANDWGMALKWLMDYALPEQSILLSKINGIEARLSVLEQNGKAATPEKKEIKMLDGKTTIEKVG